MMVIQKLVIFLLIIIDVKSLISDSYLSMNHVGSLFLPLTPLVPFLPVILTDFYPRDTPISYFKRTNKHLNNGKSSFPTKPVLVCFGDSLTHGSVSANWVDRVEARHSSSLTVLNAGVNSETARAARFRLEDIVAVQPDMMTVLLGTNDLIGSLDGRAATMYQVKLCRAHWDKRPNLDLYEKELTSIIQELDRRLKPTSKIALLSPPPLGEGGFSGVAWTQGAALANVCKEICNAKSFSHDRLQYIPLFETISNQMTSQDEKLNHSILGKEFRFEEAIPLTAVIVPWNLLLGRSFESVRKANGFKYTIDGVHFADDFSSTVESLICEWIENTLLL